MNPWNLDALQTIEEETHARVYTVLQLRVHPALVQLREKLMKSRNGKKHDVVLTYITSRGTWYHFSWKGQLNKSGGIATNIGIHFFDLLIWLFGKPINQEVHYNTNQKMAGFIELANANVRWMLSIDSSNLPAQESREGKKTYRSILVDGEEIQFSEGFTDLHSRVYEETLAGRGFGIEDARQSIELVYNLRNLKVKEGEREVVHPGVWNG
jgi:UDP-N-acetyl-2-amino-2-deoxyglucuronate dehydrogenase